MNKRVVSSLFTYFFSLVALLAVSIGIFVYWAVGDQLPKRSQLPIDAPYAEAIIPQSAPEELVVVTYNMGHGQGVKDHAEDYRDKPTTMTHLTKVAEAINRMNADIVMLQEVDIDSQRTYRVDQVKYIQERTKHAYVACANLWEKNYLPFPYWPPVHHLGYMRMANCILSRYPLKNQERIVFDKPESNPFWYNFGYIDRGIQRVDVTIGTKNLTLLNLHLDAWENLAREKQIKVVNEYLGELNYPVIIGGDFNTVPADASMKSGFVDDPGVDYSNEQTLTWFIANVKDIKAPAFTMAHETDFDRFTFRSDSPNRLLDHIFLVGPSLSFSSYRVVKEAGTASDHLPVMATIRYDDLLDSQQ